MDKKKGILWYFSQVFMLYGIIILFISAGCKLYGEEGAAISTIFSLGDKGLAVSTMFEFFLVIVIIVLLRLIFMTDMIIKKMPLVLRSVAMITVGLLVAIGFIFAERNRLVFNILGGDVRSCITSFIELIVFFFFV